MGVLDTILFTIAGNGVSLSELISVILGLSCVFLAGRGKVLNFWFGYFYNIFLFILFASHNLYFSMALQPVSFIINLIGHYRWTHPREGEENAAKELKITRLTTPYRARYIIFVVMLALILGWAMQEASVIWPGAFPPAKKPFLDAFVTMMILTAQYLSAQKKMECWFAWTVVNTTNIVLYILAGLVFMPIVSACYLVLAYFGFKSWRKLEKEQ